MFNFKFLSKENTFFCLLKIHLKNLKLLEKVELIYIILRISIIGHYSILLILIQTKAL